MTWLRDYKMNNRGPYYDKSSSDTYTYLPIKVHIAGNNAGGGYYKFATLLDAFCTLNEQYRPYGWQFYIYDEVNYINSEVLNQHTSGYQTIIRNQSVPNVINMFFVANPDGACGYFSGWGGPQNSSGNGRQGYIAINNSCGQNKNTTIAHELGHFFSLPHTFYGWEGRTVNDAPRATDERVNGSNCNNAGDYFCDTPADFISDRWRCPYSLTKVDYVGTPYNPDGSLYMSYANDECANHHSQEQVDAMKSYLTSERPYLLNHNFPNYPVITDSTALLCPRTGATDVPSNYANLKWSEVEGATHFFVEVTRTNNPNNVVFDTIISSSNTSVIVTNLSPGFAYRWRVRAFNKYSTCSPFAAATFTAAPATSMVPEILIDPITCAGAYNGAIAISVTGGTGPYNYSWSSGLTDSTLTYLEGGNYQLTITDNNNERLMMCIALPEPDTLSVGINVSSNNIIALPNGGTAPYTYTWSNGSTTAGIIAQQDGSYSVTVTDKNGCSITNSYSYVGIGQVDAASSLRVYPNPAVGSAGSFTVEFNVPQPVSATIEVLDNTGRRVYSGAEKFDGGNNVTQISTAQMSPGLYLVRIIGADVVKTTKVLVY